MKISVIIPAYNSAKFIAEAIESAFRQPETDEVIVVNDGSTDQTKTLVVQLQPKFPNLIYLEHQDGLNHGAGISRNLGIQSARNEFIAFLDADDFYLPGRFNSTVKVFEEHADADGVYECLGIYFQDDIAKKNWLKRFDFELTTLKERVSPEKLMYKMTPLGRSGWFSGDALVVKKSIFEKSGYYSDLRLSQDTELFMKMAITSRLYPGNINSPVAIRRVHDANRVTTDKLFFFQNRIELWRHMLKWVVDEGQSKKWVTVFMKHRLKSGLITAKLENNLLKRIWTGILALINYIFSRNWFYFLFGIGGGGNSQNS